LPLTVKDVIIAFISYQWSKSKMITVATSVQLKKYYELLQTSPENAAQQTALKTY
jgi:hypothetical protein